LARKRDENPRRRACLAMGQGDDADEADDGADDDDDARPLLARGDEVEDWVWDRAVSNAGSWGSSSWWPAAVVVPF